MIPLYTLIPYWYFLKTRLNGFYPKVSWFFVYFVPSGFLYFQFADIKAMSDWAILIVSILLLNYIYENGYIENDIKTIRKEKKPTLRLSVESIRIIDHNLRTIFIARVIITFFLLALYFVLAAHSSSLLRPADLVLLLILLQLLYLWYNRVRNITNLFLVIPLSLIRFFGMVIPFVPIAYVAVFLIISSFLYPVSKFLEFTKRERFNLLWGQRMIGNVDKFRVTYYLLLALLLVGIMQFFPGPYIIMGLKMAIYYFLYRMLGLLAIGNRKILSAFKGNFGRK